MSDLPAGCEADACEQGRKIYCRKWATKHEFAELKAVWFDPIKAVLRRKTNEEWTRTNCGGRRMGAENCCTILTGQMKTRVKDVTKKRARRSTDCITARVGRKSEDRFQSN